jgi:hypothetical protein
MMQERWNCYVFVSSVIRLAGTIEKKHMKIEDDETMMLEMIETERAKKGNPVRKHHRTNVQQELVMQIRSTLQWKEKRNDK